jgi:hypothetical protein
MVYAKDIIFESGQTQFMVTYLALEVHTELLRLILIDIDIIYQMDVKEHKQHLGMKMSLKTLRENIFFVLPVVQRPVLPEINSDNGYAIP